MFSRAQIDHVARRRTPCDLQRPEQSIDHPFPLVPADAGRFDSKERNSYMQDKTVN